MGASPTDTQRHTVTRPAPQATLGMKLQQVEIIRDAFVVEEVSQPTPN